MKFMHPTALAFKAGHAVRTVRTVRTVRPGLVHAATMPALDARQSCAWHGHALQPLLLAAALSLFGVAAHAGSCNVTTPGAASCVIPAGVASVLVVATGAGGGASGAAAGGNGGVVTQTLTGVGGTTLSLYVGGGGGSANNGGSGGGSSNVNAATVSQIIAGGGGGAAFIAGSTGGDGNGSSGGYAGLGLPGSGGSAGAGGAGGGGPGLPGSSGNGGAGGSGNFTTAGSGSGTGTGGSTTGGGGGGGGYGGGGGGGGGAGGGGGGSTGGAVSVASNAGAIAAGGSNGGNGSIVVTWTDPVAAVSIPTLATVAVVPGVGTQPAVLDLGSGQGPAMTKCLLAAVQGLLGADAAYAGQGATGVAKFTQGGRTIAFYPLQANSLTSATIGVGLTSSNLLTVATTCGTFTVAPALSGLTDFGALLTSMGLQANTSAQGVITMTAGSTVYTFRPDYFATSTSSSGTAVTPSLSKGGDGLYRFTDNTGTVQILRPAFVDTDALAAQAPLALSSSGSVAIQTDGTALFTPVIGTQRYVLTPDLTLTAAPPANAAQLWWSDVANHYLVRSSVLTAGQGFTVK